MQRALKLALVDPRQLRGLATDDKHVEYRELNKSVDGQGRAGLSLEMKHILSDPSIPDDLKMRMYNRTLDRFLNVSDTAKNNEPLPPIQINWTHASDDLQQPTTKKSKKKNKKKITPLVSDPTPSRKSSRLSRQKRRWLEL
jgi:hypothetical protein